jgi:asparagine synthase (glutamine-hydrolysing)
MCGIYGILGLSGELDTEEFRIFDRTVVLKHRGPDDYGHFVDSHIHLGHRRLSIIDLESGKQPIFNEDRTKCIIFNGEIYNFQEIRRDLEARGHQFNTNSDTETIIHAYEEWDKDCVGKLNGMFCFAIWDIKNRKLFAARDRLGIKPFFYAVYGDVFYFASEMKAILQYSDFPREIDQDALASFFTLSYIPAPLTIFKHIRKLLPGHTIEIKGGQIKINKYWDINFHPDRSKSEGYFVEGFMGLLEEAVSLRMISDVPLGAFLSGGIDSGIIVALMSRHSSLPINTFCIGFGGNIGGYLDEREYAKQVALRYEAIHNEQLVAPSLHGVIDDIVRSFDEPFADSSAIPSYYLSKMTREKVTVALSGLGGDELFGGYERYLGFKLSSFYNRLPWFVREKFIKGIVEKIPERTDGHYTINHLKRFVRSASLPQDKRYLGFSSMLSKERKKSLFSDPSAYRKGFSHCEHLILDYFNAGNAEDPLDRVFYCDIKTYLPEDILACTDRMSMRHSLEVRVPFLDHKLVEFCATIPNEMKIRYWDKKHILKKAALDILPKEVVTHRKQGFVGPMTRWLQTDLKSYVLNTLSDKNLNKHGILNPNTVKTILDEHFNRIEINDKLIWTLVMFQNWYNLYIEGYSSHYHFHER